jgi:hypothetical protein
VGDIDHISLSYVGLQTTCLLVYNTFTPDDFPKSRAQKSGRKSRSFSTLAQAFTTICATSLRFHFFCEL